MTKIYFNTRLLLNALAVLLPFLMGAQDFTYKYHRTDGIKPIGGFVPSEIQQKFAPFLVPEEMPYPGVELDREAARKIKNAQKTTAFSVNAAAEIGAAQAPDILDTLRGNNFSGSVPNDDSFAISPEGKAISVRNSTVGAYDVVNDSIIFQSTLFRFFRPGQFIPGSKYDPRAIYDPKEDRFIILYLSGTTYQVSEIIVGFSKSNDPADGFNMYRLNGNPLNDSTWSDYPHISLSEEDLFITVNTFFNGSTNNSGYVQSTIRQINKSAGYDSLPLTEHYYSDLESGGKALFNFTGMTGGKGLLPPPTYFLSNRNLDTINDSIFVVKIDDRAVGNPQLSMTTYTTENPYGLPPDARQKNSHTFDCNDSRIQGGFVQNDRIQFVGNTMTPDTNAGIYHGMIHLAAPSTNNIYFKILSFDPIDIGYPQISYTGKSYPENEGIITFNHTGDTLNAGFSTVFFDNDSTYSDMKIVVEGGDFIDIITNSGGSRLYERWGDYTGSQPMYGDTGVVWASGYEASPSGQPLTAIVKLRSPNYASSPIVSEKEWPKKRDFSVAPNPSTNWFELSFERQAGEVLNFTLVNINGAQSQQEFTVKEYAYEGKNTFRFNTSPLSAGIYILIIEDENGALLQQKKLVIQ